MGNQFLRTSGLAACILLAASLYACGGSHKGPAIISDAAVGSPVLIFQNSFDQENITRLMANPFDHQAGVSGSALLISTINDGDLYNQLTVDLMGNVGIRGHFVSLLQPVPRGSVDASTDAESLLDALPIGVYRLGSDPNGAFPRIGTTNSTPSGTASPAQPAPIDLTTSVAVDVAATRQLIREVAELKAEVAELKREVGR